MNLRLAEIETEEQSVRRYSVAMMVLLIAVGIFLSLCPMVFVDDDDDDETFQTVMTAACFVVLLALLMRYMTVINRRHAALLAITKRSKGIVDQLFPSGVRDRVRSFFSAHVPTKRTLTSPPQPSAKQTRASSPEISDVSLSLADLCLSSPEDLLQAMAPSRATRSKGPAPDVPDINFSVESKAYQRRLAALPGPSGEGPPPAPPDVTPSTVPAGGEGSSEQDVPGPSPAQRS